MRKLTHAERLARKASKPEHDGRACKACKERPAPLRWHNRDLRWGYDWCQPCVNAHPSKGRSRKPDAKREGRWGGNTYASISPREWCAVYDFQRGLCAICQKRLIDRYRGVEGSAREEVAQVDHCWVVERRLLDEGVEPLGALRRSIRGLLCKGCNYHLLPRVQHDWEKAQRAADYLRTFAAQEYLDAPLDAPRALVVPSRAA